MVMVAKLMTFSDVLIKLNKHNVSFASTLCHDGHMIFFVGSCPIEFMMEAACLRAPVFHGAHQASPTSPRPTGHAESGV